MSTVLKCIDKLIRNISITEGQEDEINKAYEKLREHLLNKENNLFIKDVFLEGSYIRGTIIKTKRLQNIIDINVFVVFNEKDYIENGFNIEPAYVHKRIQNYLETISEYKNNINRLKEWVTISISNIEFDITPLKDGLYLPDYDQKKWVPADPKGLTNELNRIDSLRDNKVKKVIKAIRRWKEWKNYNFPAYHIEELAIKIFENKNFTTLEEGIMIWFNNVSYYIDILKFNNFESYKEVTENILNVKSKLYLAVRFQDENNEKEALKIWKRFFWRKVPMDDKWVIVDGLVTIANG